MSLNLKTGLSTITIPQLYAQAVTDEVSTVGDFFKDYVTPKFKEIFGDAVYTESRYDINDTNIYPVILLPDISGSVTSGICPGILFKVPSSNNLSGLNTIIYLNYCLIELSTKDYHSFSINTSFILQNSLTQYRYVSRSNTVNVTSNNLNIWVSSDSDFMYSVGLVVSNNVPVCMTQDLLVTKLQDVKTEEDVPAIIILPAGDVSNLTYYVVSDGVQHSGHIGVWNLTTSPTSANMYEFNDCAFKSDKYYVCFPNEHIILKNFLRISTNTPKDMWSSGHVTINGSKFKLRVTTAGESVDTTGNRNMTIARKDE